MEYECAINLDQATIKKLSKLLPDETAVQSMTRKIAFSKFLQSSDREQGCCGVRLDSVRDLQRHISEKHSEEINDIAKKLETNFFNLLRHHDILNNSMQCDEQNSSLLAPDTTTNLNFTCTCQKNYKVILYYHYIRVNQPENVVSWQKGLCNELNLRGKIRVAREGINGTAEGCDCAVQIYIEHMLQAFPAMDSTDFKMSDGNGKSFHELKVTECEELCSMGISPNVLTAEGGGRHISPDEFHAELDALQNKNQTDTLLLDCRNFYESKIGYFEGAVTPDLRKFSYFPAYVDKNPELFKDKRVLMYCTGGIRCERASAYINKTGICKEVLQLKGGIHKYLENYPQGHYKGKLFVFDERYSIGGESTAPVSTCKYCGSHYDNYELCSTPACRQLVLSCESCRNQGKTACCSECQVITSVQHRQQCECTRAREQVPQENRDCLLRDTKGKLS